MKRLRELKTGNGLKESGYIRRLIAEDKIDLKRMRKPPSQWLKKKYGKNNVYSEILEEAENIKKEFNRYKKDFTKMRNAYERKKEQLKQENWDEYKNKLIKKGRKDEITKEKIRNEIKQELINDRNRLREKYPNLIEYIKDIGKKEYDFMGINASLDNSIEYLTKLIQTL